MGYSHISYMHTMARNSRRRYISQSASVSRVGDDSDSAADNRPSS